MLFNRLEYNVRVYNMTLNNELSLFLLETMGCGRRSKKSTKYFFQFVTLWFQVLHLLLTVPTHFIILFVLRRDKINC